MDGVWKLMSRERERKKEAASEEEEEISSSFRLFGKGASFSSLSLWSRRRSFDSDLPYLRSYVAASSYTAKNGEEALFLPSVSTRKSPG